MNSKSSQYVLALDLGTTGNRAILFDAGAAVRAEAYKESPQNPHRRFMCNDLFQCGGHPTDSTSLAKILSDSPLPNGGSNPL